MKAVVFAYHDVGVRCLKTLLARGVDVPLVVTHADSPAENIWFHSVANVCREYGIPCLMPEDPASPQLQEQVQTARPDFIFSFYYRRMLPPSLLAMARHGAYNMHGSLLPKYRGRAPVNWAILHGETETGATLHAMMAKPDAGAIVAQTAVPILPDDTAFEVFGKVVLAAEQTLWRVLPSMLAGCPPTLPNDLSKGSYFSGRAPEDGRIDWGKTAQHIHNLVRAVAPPYPGAFEEISGDKITLARTRMVPANIRLSLESSHRAQDRFFEDDRLYARCGDGNYLQILSIRINDQDVPLNSYLEYMAA
ncbi:MAG TPA: formyltransferase [Herbaspirillum sp.]|nr:formyltransferase [Herbaspirillum sp.]